MPTGERWSAAAAVPATTLDERADALAICRDGREAECRQNQIGVIGLDVRALGSESEPCRSVEDSSGRAQQHGDTVVAGSVGSGCR